MESLVEERDGAGPFTSLEDFAARIDPRLLNRRQLESLAGAGAFDGDQAGARGGVRRRRDDPCSRRERSRTARPAARRACSASTRPRPRRSAFRAMRSWTLAQRMAAEREAFGFYFSAHPVDSARHLLAAHKVEDLRRARRHADRRRRTASARPWPALVEDTRWRTSAKGRRYMMATLSDSSRPVRGDGVRR